MTEMNEMNEAPTEATDLEALETVPEGQVASEGEALPTEIPNSPFTGKNKRGQKTTSAYSADAANKVADAGPKSVLVRVTDAVGDFHDKDREVAIKVLSVAGAGYNFTTVSSFNNWLTRRDYNGEEVSDIGHALVQTMSLRTELRHLDNMLGWIAENLTPKMVPTNGMEVAGTSLKSNVAEIRTLLNAPYTIRRHGAFTVKGKEIPALESSEVSVSELVVKPWLPLLDATERLINRLMTPAEGDQEAIESWYAEARDLAATALATPIDLSLLAPFDDPSLGVDRLPPPKEVELDAEGNPVKKTRKPRDPNAPKAQRQGTGIPKELRGIVPRVARAEGETVAADASGTMPQPAGSKAKPKVKKAKKADGNAVLANFTEQPSEENIVLPEGEA